MRGARRWMAGVAAGMMMLLAGCGGSGEATSPAAAAATEGGTDRAKALTVPGTSVLNFAANGWWWNPNEGGTGFMFEAQGNKGFVAFFMYEEGSGKPVWYAADGAFVALADGSYAFSGDLRYYSQGQPVASSAYQVPVSRSIGSASIVFNGNNAVVQLPGRNINATRYDFGGLASTPKAGQPEVGWYYNSAEGGRGYAIEVQNDKLFMAMFHYNADGSPTWNVVDGNIASGLLTNTFQLFSGGQSLGSGYRSPGNQFALGSYTLSFRNACAGQVQLAGAPPVSVRRFVFGDLPAGSECRSSSAATADTVPGVAVGPIRMQPGDAIHGRIDTAGDIDAYGISLQAGVNYVFDLKGAPSASGTLADPILALHDAALVRLLENNDIATAQKDSRITFMPSVSGTYYLAVRANGVGVGSFLLSASGVAPELKPLVVLPAASFAGNLTATLTGRAAGTANLVVDAAGSVSGNLLLAGSPMTVVGTLTNGGVLRFNATGQGNTLSFAGELNPEGKLSGTWADAAGPGGVAAGQSNMLPPTNKQLTVRARASLMAGVGPTMVVLVDGMVIGSVEVKSTVLADYLFQTPVLQAGSKVDVVFTNDLNGNGEDRNLFVGYVTDGQLILLPTAPGSLVDRGAGDRAFDGLDVLAATGDLYSSSALRMTWQSGGAADANIARKNAASRFLQQASFGPSSTEIDRLVGMGEAAWITEQQALPASNDFVNHVQQLYDQGAAFRPNGASYDTTSVVRRFWQTAHLGQDQLRKRTAWSLHQIFMVSQADSNLYSHTRAYANYLDTLNRQAFGNYRNLLEDIALSPVMGIYLSHIRNRKEDPATGRLPDENFAREVMQLFSIGLVELNQDGSPRLDGTGKPIETYNNADVMAMAKVFTGWSWGFPDAQLTSNTFRFSNPNYALGSDQLIDLQRMKAYPGQSSTAEKPLFAGKASAVLIPANTSAADSLRMGLDALFNHPNVGPFIGRQLIQRFTTSHPSPAYVSRVAGVFNNNGQGVRGDLGAVVRAILLDPEARQAPASDFGKLREPVLRVSHWMRAMGATSVAGNYMMVGDLDSLSQRPYSAPSVFSYFRPGYVPPNSVLSQTGATAPEFQIVNETTAPTWVNLAENMAGTGIGWTGTARDVSSTLGPQVALISAGNLNAVVDNLNLLLFAGRMSAELRQDILDAVAGVGGSDAASHLNRARVAVFMALSSPEYLVQR